MKAIEILDESLKDSLGRIEELREKEDEIVKYLKVVRLKIAREHENFADIKKAIQKLETK